MRARVKTVAAAAGAGLLFTPTVWMLKRKSENPEAGWPHTLMNTLLTPLQTLQLGPFQKEITLPNIMEAATEDTKLTDFGTPDTGKLFQLTNELLKSDAWKSLRLSPFGFVAADAALKGDMIEYLKKIHYAKGVPEVVQQPIKEPVFIVGLFRSGTTNLHRLLAMDPSRRSPKLWELSKTVPDIVTSDATEIRKDRETRRAKLLEGIKIGRSLGDWERFDALHKVDVDLPEECQVSFGAVMSLTGIGPFFYAGMVTAGVMENLQLSAAYEHYKLVLQLLTHQDRILGEGAPTKWVMKGPIHLFGIKSLARTFPDAQLIWYVAKSAMQLLLKII